MTGYLSGPTPRAFAHRGWHVGDLDGLENTALAFERALAEGYRYLETDVHATADGKLLAFHDHFLDRVTDGQGRVESMTWDSLKNVKIGGREPIPLLADLFADFPDARFNLDAKSPATVGPLVELLKASGAGDRVCVASFSDARLRSLRQALGPTVASSLGPREVAALVARSKYLPAPIRPTTAVAAQVPTRSSGITVVTRSFVRTAHQRGLEVHVWTIDDPAEMTRLLEMGVDAIITDRPDLLRQVLTERGSWTA